MSKPILTQQPPPNVVQVEFVEGCSLACSFCGIASIRSNGATAQAHGKNSAPYRFMEAATLDRLLDELTRLQWSPRIEVAMHGEPTMHPNVGMMLGQIRQRLPHASIQLTTNGSGLLKPGRLLSVVASGVNIIVLDDYAHADYVRRIMTSDDMMAVQAVVPVYHYPADPRGNPHRRTRGQFITVVADISTNTNGTHKLTNQGGSSPRQPDLQEPLRQRCAKPFRELSVRWDGNIALCCDDWPGDYKCGNLNRTALDAIWHGAEFDAARRRLYLADRAFGPCTTCDVRSVRVGLLPDRMGKYRMPAPTPESEAALRRAQRGKVYTLKLA